jgi:hypothetical protein
MIKINLPHSTKIQYFVFTGESGTTVSTNGKLILSRGRIYKVPVDTRESLDDHNIIKLIGKVAETIDVRNIENGYAIIDPIIHNVILFDEMEIGRFI